MGIARFTGRSFLLIVTFLAIAWSFRAEVVRQHPNTCQSTLITESEAEILAYLVPDAQAARNGSSDVTSELQQSPKINEKDYFDFWLLDEKQNPYGSSTIGNFFINKHTAGVTDINDGSVHSKEFGWRRKNSAASALH